MTCLLFILMACVYSICGTCYETKLNLRAVEYKFAFSCLHVKKKKVQLEVQWAARLGNWQRCYLCRSTWGQYNIWEVYLLSVWPVILWSRVGSAWTKASHQGNELKVPRPNPLTIDWQDGEPWEILPLAFSILTLSVVELEPALNSLWDCTGY